MGEIAALLTSFCWALNSIQFTLAGRRVGSEIVNRTRLVLAVAFLSLTHLIVHRSLWPIHAEPYRWAWLGLSGTLGLILGDGTLFQAFLLIGPRRAMLLMTLVPVISTLLAWGLLGETLLPLEIVAVLVTVGGIAWVVSEREKAQNAPLERDRRDYALGLLLGILGATGQALGLVTAKRGMAGDFPALSATMIRMLVAAVALWLLTLLRGQVKATWRALEDRKALWWLVGGALVGPFVGVWLSLVAVRNAPVGIASTLMALSPIMVMPLDHWIFKEKVSARSIAGTLVALAGAAIIFMT